MNTAKINSKRDPNMLKHKPCIQYKYKKAKTTLKSNNQVNKVLWNESCVQRHLNAATLYDDFFHTSISFSYN